jgi:AraC-like DNA-binding protein
MHEDPAERWTLQKLARIAGMSRSIFAQKFKATVGEPPMEYLLRWRMALASDRLVNSRDSIAVIALSLGYESESAFGKAFKRVMHCSPRHYDRDRRARPPARANDAPLSLGLANVDSRGGEARRAQT